MELKIKEVSSKNELKEFIKFPDKLYSGSKYYIPPLHSAEINTFSHEKNHAFEFCKAKYWLVCRDGKVVGRVAGIINHKYNKKQNIKYARFGWLDFIENQEVPELLLDAVKQWATECNME
ncbi:MAG: N-acetyltransferase, partial [Bacteroidales bacterium]|nr:N-acetyltransferase [Bacteroidales bacterium]